MLARSSPVEDELSEAMAAANAATVYAAVVGSLTTLEERELFVRVRRLEDGSAETLGQNMLVDLAHGGPNSTWRLQ